MWFAKKEETLSEKRARLEGFGETKWQKDFDRSFKLHGIFFKVIFGFVFLTVATVFSTIIYTAFNADKITQKSGKSFFDFGSQSMNIGFNGMVESRCIDGYKFVVDQRGYTRQVMGENNSGVKCK